METILFLAHTEADGSLGKAALEALELARGLDGDAGLWTRGRETANARIANCGATRFLAVTGDAFAQSRYATDAAAAEALVRAAGATIVIAPHTSRWARCLPGVAQRTGAAIDTHVASITPDWKISRWYYRQRMEAVLERAQRPWFLLVDGGGPAYPAADAGALPSRPSRWNCPPCGRA